MNFDSSVSALHGGAGWRDGLSGNPACVFLEEARLVPAASGRTYPSPTLRPASFSCALGKARVFLSSGDVYRYWRLSLQS